MKKEFSIDGMTCKHCVASVEKGLSDLQGIEKVKVNLKKGNATIKYNDQLLTDEAIIQKVQEIGYQAEVI